MSVNPSISHHRLTRGSYTSYFRPTKSPVDNFDHNSDFNAKVIAIVLRAKHSHNFIPRVMRKRLRAHFHNFDHNFAVRANREPSRQFWVIELNRPLGKLRESYRAASKS